MTKGDCESLTYSKINNKRPLCYGRLFKYDSQQILIDMS